MKNKELTQEIFNDQPAEVNWAGVDYDGLLYTYASERWRGFTKIGETIKNSEYKILTQINKK